MNKKVIVSISGGVGGLVECPPGVEVEIRDYDIQCYTPEEIKDQGLVKDDEGDYYQPINFHGGTPQ